VGFFSSLLENESARWVYIGEDASRHYFYDTLHEGEASASLFKYSRDSSYLRLKTSAPPTVEFPDGSTRTFGGANGELTRLEDRFGNYLSVVVDPTSWGLTDRHGRSHTVNFTTVANTKVVSSIVFAAFDGTTATYAFSYEATSIALPYMDSDDNNPDPITVPLLFDVTGTSGAAPSVKYAMGAVGAPSYYTGSTPEPICPLGAAPPTGQLKTLTLPTKGAITWKYCPTHYPVAGDWTQFENGFGVASKTTTNTWGTGGTWTYGSVLFPGVNPTELQTTVVTPVNTSSVSYFSIPTAVSTLGWTGWEYGLPFTARVAQSGGKYLSSEAKNSLGTVVRSEWLTFAHDKLPPIASAADWYNSNRRVASARTLFVDDGGKYFDRNFSSFDGLGHFRSTNFIGDFDGTTDRTETTEFNSTRGCYEINLAQNTQTCTPPNAFVPLATTDPWVLGTYASQQQTEDGSTARQEATFTTTGFLNCVRVLKNGISRNPNDVLTTFNNGGFGFTTFQKHWGGDDQNLGTALGCGTPASPAYWIDHSYSGGVLASSQYRFSGGAAMNFFAYNATIDGSTGLVRDNYDRSGYLTRFRFDGFGRPTAIEPLGSTPAERGAKTTFAYSNASGSTAAKVKIKRECPSGVSGCSGTFGETEAHVDGFGRTWKELVRQANGTTWARRETKYNALGWRTSFSELGPETGTISCSPPNDSWNNCFTAFDSFGRPLSLKKADGKFMDFTYSGARQFSRKSYVYTTVGSADVLSETTERYDPLGRLRKVFEPSMPNGSTANTIYEYDIGNRLHHVEQVAGSTHQHRFFNYDNRGWLSSEQHPEKGTAGNGVVTYLSYDALGHPSEIQDGSSTNKVLFTFDAAERLLSVAEGGAGGRPLKSFTYGASGNGLARIVTAVRHNYLPAPLSTDYLVTETYEYNGIGRLPSKRRTQLNIFGGNQEYFDQFWTYDRGGNPTSIDYPRCYAGSCPVGGSPQRIVSPTYSFGWMTSIPGWANTIGYHLNGMLNAVGYTNNISQLIFNDPNNIPRPADIQYTVTSTGALIGALGPFTYDSSSNIKTIAGLNMTYDLASRLKAGSVYVSGVPKTHSSTFDGFGNVTSLTNNGVLRNTPTTPGTNRLTSASFDAGGNMTAWNGANFTFDRLNMPTRLTNGSEDWIFAYTSDDERILEYRVGGSGWKTPIRDLDGRVLREFSVQTGWPFEDYIYRGRTLLASVSPSEGTRYFGPDHLGTPRAVFNSAGTVVAVHTYYPFGEEASPATQDTQQLKFTGHERDLLNTPTNPADDTDYMHARQFSTLTARFMSCDPVLGNPHSPQTWNLYSYVLGNPLKYVDPFGLEKLDVVAKDPCSSPIEPECLRQPEQPINTDREREKPDREREAGEEKDRCAGTTIGVSGSVSGIFGISNGQPVFGVWGINIQFLPGAIGIYEFGSLRNSPSKGGALGGSLTSNIGIGSGHWGGEFLEGATSVGPFATGAYMSPNGPSWNSWTGVAGGFSSGAPVGHLTSTNFYEPLLVVGPNASECR
jgi:RHS repeat-associated protein